MSKELDISKLLDEEIKKASNYFFPPEEQDSVLDKVKLVKAIADEVNSRIRGKHGASIVFSGLLGLFDELSVEPFWANQIFYKIHSKLKSEQRKSKPEEELFDGYKGLLFELRLMAVSYIKKQIHIESKDDDLPKKLKLIRKTLAGIVSHEDLFKREALAEVQKEIENEIALKKEEINHRKLLEIAAENKIEENNVIKKHKDITLDRAVLAMSYLLDELNVKCPLSKKKEFIAFLTPFSPNTIKTKLENLHEKQDKNFVEYEKDLDVISKYFENLGLVKIVEQIKKDLEFE